MKIMTSERQQLDQTVLRLQCTCISMGEKFTCLISDSQKQLALSRPVAKGCQGHDPQLGKFQIEAAKKNSILESCPLHPQASLRVCQCGQ